jgi:hypothetical protein
MLAFWCNYYINWTNCTWVLNQANLVNLTQLYNFEQQLNADVKAKMPKFPEKFADLCKSCESIEDIDQEWINSSFGDNFPLLSLFAKTSIILLLATTIPLASLRTLMI